MTLCAPQIPEMGACGGKEIPTPVLDACDLDDGFDNEKLQEAIKADGDVNERDERGWTPLHRLCATKAEGLRTSKEKDDDGELIGPQQLKEIVEAINLLIDSGAEVNAQTVYNENQGVCFVNPASRYVALLAAERCVEQLLFHILWFLLPFRLKPLRCTRLVSMIFEKWFQFY